MSCPSNLSFGLLVGTWPGRCLCLAISVPVRSSCYTPDKSTRLNGWWVIGPSTISGDHQFFQEPEHETVILHARINLSVHWDYPLAQNFVDFCPGVFCFQHLALWSICHNILWRNVCIFWIFFFVSTWVLLTSKHWIKLLSPAVPSLIVWLIY